MAETATPLYEAMLLVGKILGMSRSVGMVFAVLYSSDLPLTVETIMQETNLSKSAVSLALRDLLLIGAVQEIGIRGERCRFYAGKPDLSDTVKQLILNRMQPPLHDFREKLALSPQAAERTAQAHSLLAAFDDIVKRISED